MQNGLSRAPRHVLFVDDDADVQKAARLLLARHDMRMSSAKDPAEAWSVLAAGSVDLILLDLNFARGATSGAEGFACLAEIMDHDPQAVVVVVTGHSGVAVAVQAMRAGPSDFVMKPWRNERLIETLERALAARRRPQAGKPFVGEVDADQPLLDESAAMQRVRDLIRRAAPTDAAVLIHGAAGTGKSLMARTLHRQSARRGGPFVAVDLAGLSAEAAGLALFGDEGSGVVGAIASASGGTLVLDEIAALTPRLQARLLEALKAQTTFRIVSISTRRREALKAQGGLGNDLLYLLNTVEIAAPTLCGREDDARVLAEHFLRLFALRHGRGPRPLTDLATAAIAAHPWPGDVRALRQAMERCVIFAEGDCYDIGDIPFPEAIDRADGAAPLNLVQSERALVSAALKSNSFNVSHAARQLGLTRAALYRRMAKYGL
jgi:DNA-binding NtrC family response regulator